MKADSTMLSQFVSCHKVICNNLSDCCLLQWHNALECGEFGHYCCVCSCCLIQYLLCVRDSYVTLSPDLMKLECNLVTLLDTGESACALAYVHMYVRMYVCTYIQVLALCTDYGRPC